MGIRKLQEVRKSKFRKPKLVGKKQRRKQMLAFTIDLFGKDIVKRLEDKNIDLIQAQAEIQVAYARWIESEIGKKIESKFGVQETFEEIIQIIEKNCIVSLDETAIDQYGKKNPLNILSYSDSGEIIFTWYSNIDLVAHITKIKAAQEDDLN